MRPKFVLTGSPSSMTPTKVLRVSILVKGTLLVQFAATTLIRVFVAGRTFPAGDAFTVVIACAITTVRACAVTVARISVAVILVFGTGGAFPSRGTRARVCMGFLTRVRAFASVGTRFRETVVHILVAKFTSESLTCSTRAHSSAECVLASPMDTFGLIGQFAEICLYFATIAKPIHWALAFEATMAVVAFSIGPNTRFGLALYSGIFKQAVIYLSTDSSVAFETSFTLASVGAVSVGARRIGMAAVCARSALIDIYTAILACEFRGAMAFIIAYEILTPGVVLAVWCLWDGELL